MRIIPGPGFDVIKTWKVTGSNNIVESGDPVLTEALILGSDAMLVSWNVTAKLKKDSYMEWLLRLPILP